RGTSFSRDDFVSEGHPSKMKGTKKMPTQLMARSKLVSEDIEWQTETSGASLATPSAQRLPYKGERPAQPSGSALIALKVRPAKSETSPPSLGLGRNVASAVATAETTPPATELRPKEVPPILSTKVPSDNALSSGSTSSERSVGNFIASVHRTHDELIPPEGALVQRLPSPPEAEAPTPKATGEQSTDAAETRQVKRSSRKDKTHAKRSKKRTVKKEGRKRGPSDRHHDDVTNNDGIACDVGATDADIFQRAQRSLEQINKRMGTFQSMDELDPALEPLIFSRPDSVVMSPTGEVSVFINLNTGIQHSMMWPFGRLHPR
ncbi:unnamed protein product, partial [Ixodes hexagonus]